VRWEDLPALLRTHLSQAAQPDDGAGVAAVLSPMLNCEEAWLLATFIRQLAPRATLVLGHVPVVGQDQTFRKGFVIKAEKCPNRRGVERIIAHFGGASAGFREFLGQALEGRFRAAYLTAGYPEAWATPDVPAALGQVGFLVIHDLFPSSLDDLAHVRIPGAAWVEREGTFMNCDGLVQAFERAIPPPEGVKADGQFLHELAGGTGLYRAAKVRETLAPVLPQFAELFVPRAAPLHAH
jgi:NADH-quinone oxidoreductase subunit G